MNQKNQPDVINQMESKYPVKRLYEVGVTLFDCDHRTPKPTKIGYPYIAIPQIQQGRLDLSEVRFISKEDYESWIQRNKPQSGDIIVTRRARVGDTAVIPDGFECAIGQNLVILRSDGTQVDQSFLRWALRGPFYERQMSKFLNVGALFDSLNCGDIPQFELPIPTLPTQHAIARILGSLDDKIELNRQMNETLEAMARAIFQSWFVDFDPVRAKAEGKQPAGMDAETAALFPDGFEEVDGREVPKGWRIETLGNAVEMTTGRSYTSDELQESTTALVTLKSFQRGGGYRQDGLKPFTGKYKPEQVIQPGELIISFTDVTQAAEVIGKPALVSSNPEIQTLVASLDVGIIRPKDERVNIPFLYLLLRNDDYQSYIYGYCSGTTVLHLNKSGVPKYEFICPDPEIMKIFSDISKPIFDEIQINIEQSRTLAQIRDALLPKLMSGEISISNDKTDNGALNV